MSSFEMFHKSRFPCGASCANKRDDGADENEIGDDRASVYIPHESSQFWVRFGVERLVIAHASNDAGRFDVWEKHPGDDWEAEHQQDADAYSDDLFGAFWFHFWDWLASHTRTAASGESAGPLPFMVTYCARWSLPTAQP